MVTLTLLYATATSNPAPFAAVFPALFTSEKLTLGFSPKECSSLEHQQFPPFIL